MGLVGGALSDDVQFIYQSDAKTRIYLVATAPRVEVSSMIMVAQSIISNPVVAQYGMSIEEQKLLGRFFRLAPPRFFGALSNDTYEFLISCKNRLHNLSLIEARDMDYTTF